MSQKVCVQRGSSTGLAIGALALACVSGQAFAQTDLLPDIIVRQSDLFDNRIEVSGGQTFLRLSNGTANIGDGPLYLYGGQDNGDGTQDVHQRIFADDGSFTDRLAGTFTFHPTHGHIHYNDWSEYRIREITAGGGVGPILAKGVKTSFCIIDLGVYDSSLPGFVPGGFFRSCGTQIQGLSVGWIDVYSSFLTGQAINITNIPDGQYWLESMVDPRDTVLEKDETNNTARILVTLGPGGGGTIDPDRFEQNDSRAETGARPEGTVNSPNLGPVGPERTILDLTIDAPNDDDYFRFYMPATGGGGDFVTISFDHDLGDIDMSLMTESGSVVATSQGVSNSETISLAGRSAGWYYIRVYGWSGATTPDYDMTINPSANGAPTVVVIDPPAGDTQRDHGNEVYTVTWTYNDPENNEAWVTIALNTHPDLDGHEIVLPTGVNVPADLGFYIINSAEVPPDTYWVNASITDGGSETNSWSPGTISFIETACIADMTGSIDPNNPGFGVPDGTLDANDFFYFLFAFENNFPLADMSGSSDPNSPFWGQPDGIFDANDFFYYLSIFADGCP